MLNASLFVQTFLTEFLLVRLSYMFIRLMKLLI